MNIHRQTFISIQQVRWLTTRSPRAEECLGLHQGRTGLSHQHTPLRLKLDHHLFLGQVAGKPGNVQVGRALWHIFLHWLWCRRVCHLLSHWLCHRLRHRCRKIFIQPGTLGSMGWLQCRAQCTPHSTTTSYTMSRTSRSYTKSLQDTSRFATSHIFSDQGTSLLGMGQPVLLQQKKAQS